MSQRICLLALIGLPAAGKSQLSECLLNETLCNFNVIHLCYDHFMEIPTSTVDSQQNTYKKQREQILHTLRELISCIQQYGRVPYNLNGRMPHRISESYRDYVIICDDNNYYASMRYKLYQLCRQHGLAYAQLYLNCPLSQCVHRNDERLSDERVPQHILLRMCERLDMPKVDLNLWEANTLNLYAADRSVEIGAVVRFLQQSFDKMPAKVDEPVEYSLEATQSVVHQLDLLLRQRIRELLQSLDKPEHKATKAQHLNDKRKDILITVRQQLSRADSSELTCKELSRYVMLLN